jgi:hypothetical protein
MTENLDLYFDDFGVSVSWEKDNNTTVETMGVLDMPDEELGGGLLQSTEYSLLVKTAEFIGIQKDDEIIVDGEDYVVRSSLKRVDDGKLARIGLSKV